MVWVAWQAPLQNMGRKQNHEEGDRVHSLLKGVWRGVREEKRGVGEEREEERAASLEELRGRGVTEGGQDHPF